MKQNKNYDKLFAYGQSIGLSTDYKEIQEKGLFSYLEEAGYGHKPDHIRFMKEMRKADTTKIKLAAWELAEGDDLAKVMEKLEPPFKTYKQLKNHYIRLVKSGKQDSARAVSNALNTYRWIHRQAQGSNRMVLVNIRGAYLRGLDSLGNEVVRMNVIVGKAGSPTPGLDTYATNVIPYPYWNVPKSIALSEMLPRIRENVYYLERNGIDVLDKHGKVVNVHEIAWDEVSEENFPYRFRQETGEDNSLGLMKVNIDNPYAIYLHDTNVRSLFEAKARWRSHGCIRLERPAQLANFLAGEKILKDNFIEEGIATPEADRKPTTLPLKKKVPVFIYYLPADVNESGGLVYFDDVYSLEKGTN